MKLSQRILLTVVPTTAFCLIRFLYWSLRVEYIGKERLTALWGRQEKAILSFWHDQLLLMVCAHPGEGAKMLISASGDGELLARTLCKFGHDAVRGSSSRGGRSAFKELLSQAKAGADICLTPDGPRGPRHVLKEGVIQLARLSKQAVVPIAFVCDSGYRFNSWDKFLLPYPFSRGVYSIGEPLYYQDYKDPEMFRQHLQKAMMDNQQCAVQRLEEHGLSPV